MQLAVTVVSSVSKLIIHEQSMNTPLCDGIALLIAACNHEQLLTKAADSS